jgi:hypothetical protein
VGPKPKKPPRFDSRPDFAGLGNFTAPNGATESCECCLFLPKDETAKIWMLIRTPVPTRNVAALSWRFSCELKVGGNFLAAEQVFHSGFVQWDWGRGAENTLVGEIVRLTAHHGDVHGTEISAARFVTTSSALLRSADILSDDSGQLAVKQVVGKGPVCRASPEIAFAFGSKYRRNGGGERQITIGCELLDPSRMRDSPEDVVSSLADVLTLASLAERRRIMLTGWQLSYANNATTTYYRRDFSVSDVEEPDVDETLISLQSIEEFLNRGMVALTSATRTAALKQAIDFALLGQSRAIGEAYVMLFAGIESLLGLTQAQSIEPIVPADQWQLIANEILPQLDSFAPFMSIAEDDKITLRNHILAANRRPLSFGYRFKQMCSSKRIDLSDLWPMSGGKSHSLSDIRNRIVHGSVFTSDQEWFKLVAAKYHLYWTLERSILAHLDWPVAKSRVSSRCLCGMTLYSTWLADSAILMS